MEGDDWTQPNDPIQDIMAGIAAALPCGYHGPDAACDRCPAGYGTDCHGFPHPRAVPHGVRRLRHCPSCRELVAPEQWDTRPTGVGQFPKLSPWRCLECSADAASAPAGEASAGEALPAKHSTRA
jgi:hypothetical protein